MADYIEGRREVEEALRAGVRIKRVLVQKQTLSADKPQNAKPSRAGSQRSGARGHALEGAGNKDNQQSQLTALVDKIQREFPNVVIEQVDKAVLDRLSSSGASHGAHQGIMIEVPPYRYADVLDIARKASDKQDSLVIVLDHITDEGNLGAIIRTAEVVGADGVVIPSKRSAQVSVGVYKTSAGAALHLPIASVPNLSTALTQLKDKGYWVAGASEKATQDVWHAPLSGKVALVMGSEGEGISRLVLHNCDFLVSLPQAGHVGSLNVAQATTAICYEWLRQCTMRGESK